MEIKWSKKEMGDFPQESRLLLEEITRKLELLYMRGTLDGAKQMLTGFRPEKGGSHG